MRLNKQQRDSLKQKYKGKCAYCGFVLPDKWHADHIDPIIRDWAKGGCQHPERNHIDNYNPSCPSCNIMKSSLSIESFRNIIKGFMKSLNRDSTQYKFAKKYGLIQEIEIDVKFYFEKQESS